jgi:hypothetical protein
MCVFGQHLGKLRELSEDDTKVQLGARYVLVDVLVLIRRLCSKRERGKATIVGGANFCVAAGEAEESDLVLVLDSVSVVDSLPCSGHTGRSLASGAGSQVPKLCIYGGSRQIFPAYLQKRF